jgi:hypothetical protein
MGGRGRVSGKGYDMSKTSWVRVGGGMCKTR